MPEKPDNIVPITSDARTAAEKFGAKHNRELLTILFTDLVDSTKLQSDLGNVEAARLTELHREIVRDELAKYDAREIEWAGDSCLAVFEKPSDAVVFALRMQAEHRRIREREPNLALVRVGIHLGEVVVRRHAEGTKKEDLFGLQVSETARVMSVAGGDQIFCTRAVLDSARGSLQGESIEGIGDIVWVRHGLFLLKGSEFPVEICEVGSATFNPSRAPVANENCRPIRDSGQGSRSAVFWKAAAVVGALVIAVLGIALYADRQPDTGSAPDQAEGDKIALVPDDSWRPVYTPIALPSELPLAPPTPGSASVALSPDGLHLVYVGMEGNERYLVLRRRGEMESVVLEGTRDATMPFFSPDGEWLAFIANFNNELKILKLPLSGGPPQPIADVSLNFPFYWGDDGHIVYQTSFGSGLMRVSANGGEPEVFTALKDGEIAHFFPVVLPGSKGVLYMGTAAMNRDSARLMVHDIEKGESRLLFEQALPQQYLASGHIVYSQTGRLMAAPFDLETLTVSGRSFDITESRMLDSDTFTPRMTVSLSGDLAYVPIQLDSADALSLSWVDQEGKEQPLGQAPDEYRSIDIAPNGRNALASISKGRLRNFWLLDLERNTSRPLTSKLDDYRRPLWTADGQHFVFSSIRSGQAGIHLASLDDPEDAELLMDTPLGLVTPCTFTADESALIFMRYAAGNADLMIVELAGDRSVRPLLNTEHNEYEAAISPDGLWLAYTSDESGEDHVYVCSYPDLRGKTQIAAGSDARWSPDGKTLFYTQTTENIWAVPLSFEPEFRPGEPRLVYEGPLVLYDLHPDGDRFLVVKNPSSAVSRIGGREIIVVENWIEEVRRKEHLEQN